MRPALTALALSLYALAGAASASQRVDTIPAAFIGEWNQDLKDCGRGWNDSRLVVEARHVYFYESDGPMVTAAAKDKREIALLLDLSGEGEEWLATAHWRLSPDGKRLHDADDTSDSPLIRYRCPARKAPKKR